MTFDTRYRYAQLPLIAPEHPAVLRESPDGAYVNGSYAEAKVSVVARVTGDLSALTAAVQQTSFGHKIDHALTDRRKDLLHVTIAGGLQSRTDLKQALEGVRSFEMRLYGPIVGQFNTGRLYLPAESADNAFHSIQQRLNVPRTDFFA